MGQQTKSKTKSAKVIGIPLMTVITVLAYKAFIIPGGRYLFVNNSDGKARRRPVNDNTRILCSYIFHPFAQSPCDSNRINDHTILMQKERRNNLSCLFDQIDDSNCCHRASAKFAGE